MNIVLFGAGQIAQVAKAYLDAFGQDKLIGFTVDAAHRKSDTFEGLPLVDWEELEERFPPESVKLLGPLSYQRMNLFREERHSEAKRRGYAFASFVHPNSHIHAAEIGENCFILENNVIQPFVRIGKGVIIWSSNHIGHHCDIGDYCFLSSNVGLGSGVKLGPRSFLGGKVGVETGVSIGADCFLGGGAIIKHNLPGSSVVPGQSDPVAPYSSERVRRLRFR